MSTSTLDDLLAGGGKTAKFEKIGDSVGGLVTDVVIRQATNFDTGKPEFWDDMNPKQQAVISVQTPERLDADDDGVRGIYINLWGEKKKALREAAKQAGGSSPAAGDTFFATYIGDGEKPQRGFAPKLFKYVTTKKSPLDAAVGNTPTATPAAPAGETFNDGPSDALKAQIAKLIGLGLEDEKIAGALEGVSVGDVAILRIQIGANSSQGF